MIGMMVRERDRVHPADPFPQELDPHLGRRVDQQVAPRKREQDAGPGALVPGVGRGADRAIAADHGDARRGPRPQEDQAAGRCLRGVAQS